MPVKHAIYPVEFKALNDATGQVEALVSIFGNVDLQGDRVVPGAFKKSIAEWKASGDVVPVIFSHDWGDLWSHIGIVDTLEETAKGLRAVYTLDIDDNPAAAQTYKLLKRRSLKEHSFAYDVRDERRAKDGANELLDLDIIEIGPTLRGANPDTELLAVKSMIDDGPAKEQLDAAAEELTPTGFINVGIGENTSTTNATLVVTDSTKAGRRLSQATQAEMQAIREDANALMARVDSLIGVREHAAALVERMDVLLGVAEDAATATSEDPAGAKTAAADLNKVETSDSKSETEGQTATSPDQSVKAFLTRVSEMRALTGIPA